MKWTHSAAASSPTATRILRALALTVGLALILLLALVVLARFAFPNDLVRQHLERELAARLGGPVSIASLSFDPLAGLEVRDLSLTRPGAADITLDRLTLRYNPWRLLEGQLLVEELTLGRAAIRVDLASLQQGAEPTAPAVQPSGPASVPSIPLTVDLQRIHVDRTSVTITQGGTPRLDLAGLALSASISAGPTDARAAGELAVDRLALAVGTGEVALPLVVAFDLAADLAREHVSVTSLSIRSDPAFQVSISGAATEVLSTPTLDLAMHDTWIDLEPVLGIAAALLPAAVSDAEIFGVLSPSLTVSGRMGDGGFEGTAGVQLEGSALRASLPALDASLEPTRFLLRADAVPLRSDAPHAFRAEMGLSTAGLRLGAHALRDVGIQLVSALDETGQVSLRLAVDGQASLRPGPAVPRLTLPVTLAVEASAERDTQAVALHRLAATVGSLADMELQGTLAAPEGPRGLRAFSVTARLDQRTGQLLSILPPRLRERVTLVKQGTADHLRLEATGALDRAFQPRTVSGKGSVTLSGLRATLADHEGRLSGLLDQLRLAIRMTYGAETQQVRGRITGAIELAELRQKGRFGADRVTLKVDVPIHGRLAPDRSVRTLEAHPRVAVLARGGLVHQSDTTLTLPEVTLTTAAQVDLPAGRYRLDAFEVAAASLVTISGRGSYEADRRRFEASLSVPRLAVGRLARHLSGPALETIQDLRPAGRATLRLEASGTVPTPAQLRALAVPVRAQATLELHDLSAAWGGRAVRGGEAVLRLSFVPEAGRQLEAEWTMRAGAVQLAATGPLQRLEGAYTEGTVTAEEFDSVVLTGVRAGVSGAGVTLDGTLAGLGPALMEPARPRADWIAPLFVKLQATGDVMLASFAETLRAAGLEAAGEVGVRVDLLKKDDGPLSLRLRLAPRGLSLSAGGARLVELDGAMTVRKVLAWMPTADSATANGTFSPVAVLPELRLATPERDQLRVRSMEAAGLEIHTVSAGLAFDRNRLVIQDLAMDLLDGGLGGTVQLDGGRGFTVTTRLEAAQLDVNRLLPEKARVRGDSVVDATVNLTAVFDAEQGRLDFGASRLDLAVTRIGRDTLDRLLQVIDPEGSNPSIVSARSAVSLANPKTVRVSLFKGLVGLQIAFQEGVLGRFEMDRIPVGSIRQVRDLTRSIPRWEAIRGAMALIGAERYGVDRAGALVLE